MSGYRPSLQRDHEDYTARPSDRCSGRTGDKLTVTSFNGIHKRSLKSGDYSADLSPSVRNIHTTDTGCTCSCRPAERRFNPAETRSGTPAQKQPRKRTNMKESRDINGNPGDH
ncbi:hypothetical protein ABVT39_002967 [Epinephelus coioides]